MLARPLEAFAALDPELVVYNAKVYTMDPRVPRAEAFAQRRPVRRGRHHRATSGLAGKSTQTFDAKGMTIVPGFIDCHNHAGGEMLLTKCWSAIRSRWSSSHPQHRREAARARAEDAAGHLGRGLLLRRHEAERQACAQRSRSG